MYLSRYVKLDVQYFKILKPNTCIYDTVSDLHTWNWMPTDKHKCTYMQVCITLVQIIDKLWKCWMLILTKHENICKYKQNHQTV